MMEYGVPGLVTSTSFTRTKKDLLRTKTVIHSKAREKWEKSPWPDPANLEMKLLFGYDTSVKCKLELK